MTCFAFLRAINVGGHRVTMDELRALFAGLGFPDAQTFLASGNVIFEAELPDRSAATQLERNIEAGLERALGYEVATFVRGAEELGATEAAVPAAARRLSEVRAVNVAFLREPLDVSQRTTLSQLESETDEFHLEGRHLFWLCATRQSDSAFSNVVFERRVGMQATFRGINTVRRLLKKYA